MVRIYRLWIVTLAFAVTSNANSATKSTGWESAIGEVSRAYPEARIVVINIQSGRMMASHHLIDAAHTLASPGSTLKPLVLYALIQSNRWSPNRRVSCNRQLVLAGHRLACAHPSAPSFDAREALAWSCNSYFAAVARTLLPRELGQILKPTGMLGATGMATSEAVAEFRDPHTAEEVELAVLGTDGIRVTPLELTAAYRWLALQMASQPSAEATRVVSAGLEDSTSFGMANAAGLGQIPVAGKTGTALDPGSNRTHGWFAGLFPAKQPRVVIVVYLPAGRGTDAAQIAGALLAASAEKKQ